MMMTEAGADKELSSTAANPASTRRLCLVAVLLFFPLLTSLSPVADVVLALRDYLFYDNFHEVVPSRLYRSALMAPEKLLPLLPRYNIRSVIDLRYSVGPEEKRALESIGVRYIHVGFKSNYPPSRRQLLSLLNAFDKAEQPVLLHCISGQNRTSVASVIWMIVKEGMPLEKALQQMGLRYGFISWQRRLKQWTKGRIFLEDVIYRYREVRPPRPPFREWVRRWWGRELRTD